MLSPKKNFYKKYSRNIHLESKANVAEKSTEENNSNRKIYLLNEQGDHYYLCEQSIVDFPVPQDQISKSGQADIRKTIQEKNPSLPILTSVLSENSNDKFGYFLVQEENPDWNISVDVKPYNESITVNNPVDEKPQQSQTVNNEKKPVRKKLKKKKGVASHSCTVCPYSCVRRYLLLRHMKSHSVEKPHTCGVCEHRFKSAAALQNHTNTHYGVKPHECRSCAAAFTTSGELVRHVRYRHTHEKPHKCQECDYSCVELSKLRRHVRCHTGERPYQCNSCTYASSDLFKLKRHERTHTGEKPYKCTLCHQTFSQSNSLKSHMCIHNNVRKVFSCTICPVKFGRSRDLRTHIQCMHSTDVPQKCTRCGKSFPDKYSLKIHKKSHEGEKCFKCGLCPYASVSLRHLKLHDRVHSDEKPFSCDVCACSFKYKQLLRRHLNLYHNPNYVPKNPREKIHTCPDCNRSYVRRGNLISHMAKHDPNSGYHERNLALKLGRKNQVKNIDTESFKVLRDTIGKSCELNRGTMVTVKDCDGRELDVLGVVHMDDVTEGASGNLALVVPASLVADYKDGDIILMQGEAEKADDNDEPGVVEHNMEIDMEAWAYDVKYMQDQFPLQTQNQDDATVKTKTDIKDEVDNFFGFEENEDEDVLSDF